ncbi:hypothetical protein PISMIDRAFT_118780 [Pisolithus microcarpus 441]|uniref:Uncharacterized protein n=1 Tax=Pisolithus microcarpus 441 TaxID=765257 RepID=A0A0C9XMD7_9AGAM|nr:hypothetical protein PISMIDRAFT_118780 [Pisolithus microcarpus 441]
MFHKLLVDFIIADDQSLCIVKCEEFWHLLLLLKNDLKDSDIPHHTKIKSNILQAWKDYFTVLKTDLQHAVGNISFTIDIWSLDS